MTLTTKKHLAKFVKETGNFTKSEVKKLINEKRILVNGKLESLAYIVQDTDYITLDNKELKRVPLVYYIYNKPKGIICSNRTDAENNLVNRLNLPYRVFSVGRLDKDSHGLLILTNDGQFAHNLLNPVSHVEKEYIVKVKYPIDEIFIQNISKPIILRNKETLPCNAYLIDDYTFKIILNEGKYHQIRRLVIYNHNTVVDLYRIRIGDITLDNLEEGKIKEIIQNK